MLRTWLRHGSSFDNQLIATDRAETSVQMRFDQTTVSIIRHQEMLFTHLWDSCSFSPRVLTLRVLQDSIPSYSASEQDFCWEWDICMLMVQIFHGHLSSSNTASAPLRHLEIGTCMKSKRLELSFSVGTSADSGRRKALYFKLSALSGWSQQTKEIHHCSWVPKAQQWPGMLLLGSCF